MKVPVCVLRKYNKKSDNTYNFNSYTDITLFTSIRVGYGFKDKKDTFSVNFITYKKFNSASQRDEYIRPDIDIDDIINIYMYYEDDENIVWDGYTVENLDDFFVLGGVIDKIDYQSTSGVLQLAISGVNRTELLLSNLVFFQFTTTIVPNMLADTANKIRSTNKNKVLFMFKDYKGDGTDTVGSDPQAYNAENVNRYGGTIPGYEYWGAVPRGGIRAYKRNAYEYTGGMWKLRSDINLNTVNSDGDFIYRFKEQSYYDTYKSLYTHLEVISASTFTGDTEGGTYLTYVSKDNNLHWEPRKTDIDNYVTESETINTKISRQVKDVVNAVIINAGNDVRNKGILALAYNATSMSKYGAKWKYYTKSNISEALQAKQSELDGVARNATDKFPETYPVLVKSPRESSIKDGSTTEPIWKYTLNEQITDDSDYNLYIRRVAREQAKEIGRGIVSGNGGKAEPRFFGNMTLDEGTLVHNIGDYINVEVPSFDWTDLVSINLRVVEVSQQINASGWVTTLTLEEDNQEALD